MSPTGIKPVHGNTLYKGVEIITLDTYQRLPFNFAVVCGRNYQEFRTLRSARRFVREALAAA
jgi:uncharacterized protein YlxP (DUF503 family)